MTETATFACPFCGEPLKHTAQGKHFQYHRNRDEVPKPLTVDVVQAADGTWGLEARMTETNAPVYVAAQFRGLQNKTTAEKNVRRFVDEIANGRPAFGVKAKKKKGRATPPAGLSGGGVDIVDVTRPEITDAAIVAALAKLTGVKAIPVGKFDTVSRWVAETRRIAEEVQR